MDLGGPAVTILREQEVDGSDGEDRVPDLCQALYRFPPETSNQVSQSIQEGDVPNVNLDRYFISLGRLHSDICGETLQTCEISLAGGAAECSVAFRTFTGGINGDENKVLAFFSCPCTELKMKKMGNSSGFELLSELVMTLLKAFVDPRAQLIGEEAASKLDLALGTLFRDSLGGDWQHARLAADNLGLPSPFADLPSQALLARHHDVMERAEVHFRAVADTITKHFLGCHPHLFSSIRLVFTLIKDDAVLYSDAKGEVILHWVLARTARFEQRKFPAGTETAAGSLMMEESVTPVAWSAASSVYILRTRGVAFCVEWSTAASGSAGVLESIREASRKVLQEIISTPDILFVLVRDKNEDQSLSGLGSTSLCPLALYCTKILGHHLHSQVR